MYQIGDREGFALLLDRLATLEVDFSVEPVSEEVYRCAQRVRRQRKGAYSSPTESNTNRGSDDDPVRVVTSYCFDGCFPSPTQGRSECLSGGGWSDGLLTTPREAFVLLTARRKAVSSSQAEWSHAETPMP